MTEQIKQLEQQVAQLKIRVFDTQEIARAYQEESNAFKSALGEIAKVLDLTDPSTTAEQLVEAVISKIGSKESAIAAIPEE